MMRDFIQFYINGKCYRESAENAFKPLSTFLRENLGLKGTKIVCSEGDCGACTILMADLSNERPSISQTGPYQSINSCIKYLYSCDGKSIITVEGLSQDSSLNPVQEAMIKYQGSQCGFCTPGFICAMTSMADDCSLTKKKITAKKVQNYTTGNLCRCTGYQPIINAGVNIDMNKYLPLDKLYSLKQMSEEFNEISNQAIQMSLGQRIVYSPVNEDELINYLDSLVIKGEDYKFIAGGTDLGVVDNKIGHRYIDRKIHLISLDNLKTDNNVEITDNEIHIGPKATWTDLEHALKDLYPELQDLIKIFASPQIKNTATIIGNLANGSPIGDGIPFFIVSDSKLVLKSKGGNREILVSDFYQDYKKMDIQKGEYISKIITPKTDNIIKLYKVSVRKDLDISAVTFAMNLSLSNGKIDNVKIAYGGVGPIVSRLNKLEDSLKDKPFSEKTFQDSTMLIDTEIKPLSDHRGTAEYRYTVAKNLLMKSFYEVQSEVKG